MSAQLKSALELAREFVEPQNGRTKRIIVSWVTGGKRRGVARRDCRQQPIRRVFLRFHIQILPCRTLLMRREVADAEVALQDSFAFVERSGERFWLADLHRVDGQIALKRPETDRKRAEAGFLKAIEIAHAQEARVLELRAATDLARLWRDTGSPNDPHALLEPILAAIEGGEKTRDVRNDRALLAEIG
jgi:hypothetical protein